MAFTSAPPLLTPRLELRGHSADDFEACVRLWTDPVVTRYTLGAPAKAQDVWTRLLRHPGHWALLGFGYWLAFERESGRFVGEVGLASWKRDNLRGQPELASVPEAGWVLLPEFHGKGYASEAVSAVLHWRDEYLPGLQTFCLIHPENAPSLKLAENFGFQGTGEVGSGEGKTLLLLRDRRAASER